MTQLNGQTLIVAGKTTNTYTLKDVYGNAVDTTTFGTYTSGGTASRIFTLVTPWAEADLQYLKVTQSADVMSIACWNQVTGTSYAPYDLTRVTDSDWTLEALSTGASIGPPASVSGAATVTTGSNPTDYQYGITAVSAADSEESVVSPYADIPNSVDIALTAGSINLNWSTVTGASYYNVYKAPPAYNSKVPAGSLFGYAGTAFGNTFCDSNITPDFSQVPPLHLNPFYPGQIEAVNITSGASGLMAVTYSITTSTGSGFAGYPVIVQGVLVAFVVTDPGELYDIGDSIAFNGAGFATGGISFSPNPSNLDTITLNGQVWTFVSGAASTNQTQIQATLALTMVQLASDLSASADADLIVASYYSSAAAITVVYKTAGTGGDAYTLAASAGTPSGATLTGGGGSGTVSGTLTIGPQTGTYPSCVAYFQERRVYASSPNNPDTYWMSQPGAFTNFDARIPTIDSDAITGTPWAVQVNGIQAMVPMPGGLVVLTGLSAWQLTGAGGSSLNPQPITPASQQAQPQAYNGCSETVPPQQIDYDILYLQAKGSIFRDLSYNFFVNIYTGTDLTYLSSHLFTGYTIRERAWCEEPYKIFWAVRNDGVLLSLTYLKAQDVTAWARHDTNGQFWSLCSVTEPPVDALYVATQRYPGTNNAYMIERMDNRIWASIEDAWCVDAGLSLPQPEPNASLTASSSTGAGIPTGVTNLVGGTNYSSATTATILDPTGAGAVAALAIAGGVITGISFTGGTNYTYPQLIITDPTESGSGASATVTLNNSATFTASAGVFSSGSVGSVIRMGGGTATITIYTDSEHVTANITSPIVEVIPNSGGVPAVAASGNWTLTAPTTVVGGLYHLIGATVTGLADGQIIPPRVVASNGTITLATPASAITVGLGFQVQMQSLYLEAGQPTMQGRRKKVSTVTARLENSYVSTLQVGCNQPDGAALSPPVNAPPWGINPQNPLSGVSLASNQNPAPYGSQVVPLYTGDTLAIPVMGGYQKPGQVAFQQNAPVPFQLLALLPTLDLGDEPEEGSGPASRPQQPNPAQRRVA